MPELPAVCVIIPVKNRADLLRTTLCNVLGQSLPPAEVLVVDDGSTDHLPTVAAEFVGRVRFVPNEGHGPGAARNLGLRLTCSPYVQFFDSDDLMTRGKLEAQAKALAAGADVAYGPYVKAREHPDGTWTQEDVILQASPLPSPALYTWMLRGWNSITQAILFRRELLERVPAWDEQLITYEDYLYLTRLAQVLPQLAHVPREGVIYRQHGAQSTLANTQQVARARDKAVVMERVLAEASQSPSRPGAFARALLRGRADADFAFSLMAEGKIVKKTGSVYSILYQLVNKFERLKTGTAWERMHGVDMRPASFQSLVEHLPLCKS